MESLFSFRECLSKEHIDELKEHSTLAGSIKDTIGQLYLAPDHMAKIWAAISVVVVWEELLFFAVVGFLLPLIVRWWTNTSNNSSSNSNNSDSQNNGEDNQYSTPEKGKDQKGLELDDECFPDYETSERGIRYIIAMNLAQMAQLALVVYLVDIVKIVLQGVGFDLASHGELPHAFAKMVVMAWMVNRISAMKRYVLAKHNKCHPDTLKGQIQLVDRMVDAFLYCIGAYIAVDSVQEDMGAAAKVFVALGSIGTMVIGLASQGLAAQLFNGLFLASSNRIAVGDWVKFQNTGVTGKVVKLGWMETVIRGPDEMWVTIPNKDLADQRVSNVTRVQQSAVKQTLRFKYADIEKLPAVLETIKEEIKNACPTLIADGSRPFRAHLSAFNADHIAARVDCRFKLNPISNEFFENRQNVLMAISKAVKQYDIEFAVVDVTAVSSALQLLTNKLNLNDE